MGKLFIVILTLLILASVATVMTESRRQTEHTVIYWKSDANPQRYDQIDLFHHWLKENGHVDKNGRPVVELRLDSANNQSKLIQAVSGVGGDIIDAGTNEFQPLGVLRDLTEDARELGFDSGASYPGLKQDLFADGRQYAYPCNVGVAGLWCNVDAFAKYHMKPPPEIWTPEEFGRIGREFVKRANAGKKRRDVFFCSGCQLGLLDPMGRSEGLDMFNETLTACILDDPRYVKILKLVHKWTYQDGLFPTAAEVLSMNTESGYGGANFSQFLNGGYGMMLTSRYCLIRLREAESPITLSASRFPEYDFQNMIIRARTATLYRGGKHPELAKLFFAYLADKEYNDYIIEGSDGLPPNPKFAINNPIYLHPEQYPNEGDTHARELNWAMTIALPQPYSPYCKSIGINWQKYVLEKYFNGLCTAEEAAAETQNRINASIQTTVNANKRLKKRYLKNCELQKKIDAYKKAGKKLPESWIRSPYYRAYYKAKGMMAETKGTKK